MASDCDYFNALINLIETNKSLQNAIKFKDSSGKICFGAAGLLTAAAIGGPVGAVIGLGAVVGSTLGIAVSSDYKQLIKNMDHLAQAERRKLVVEVQDVVGSASISGLSSFISKKSHISALVQMLQIQSSVQNKK